MQLDRLQLGVRENLGHGFLMEVPQIFRRASADDRLAGLLGEAVSQRLEVRELLIREAKDIDASGPLSLGGRLA